MIRSGCCCCGGIGSCRTGGGGGVPGGWSVGGGGQGGWGWGLPGGLIDEGEEPAETAARELEEETGYRAGRVEHLVTFQPMVGMVESEHVVFTGRDAVKAGEPTETTEVERMEWVPLASVPELIESGEIWNAGSLVALLRLLMPGG